MSPKRLRGWIQRPLQMGTHQHHPLHPRRLAGLDLGADGEGIHLHGAQHIHRGTRPGGNDQSVAAFQGLAEGCRIAQLQPLNLGTGKALGYLRLGPEQGPHLVAPGERLLHHPPARFP